MKTKTKTKKPDREPLTQRELAFFRRHVIECQNGDTSADSQLVLAILDEMVPPSVDELQEEP